MTKIHADQVPELTGTSYPAPHDALVKSRRVRPLGIATGLSQFGVNLITLPPGGWSSQRHWHTHEDEFVWIVQGQLKLVTDAGAQTLAPGDCAGFPAGEADGHHLINETEADAVFLVIGGRHDNDVCDYPDIDMRSVAGRYSSKAGFTTKDGTPL
ncbi:MAG: cupin domain-containing protein [Pseudomonadota bacterium]